MTKYTLQDVVDIINHEGLDYAIESYINFDYIEDEKLRQLFIEADKALRAIEGYIEDRMGEDFEWQ